MDATSSPASFAPIIERFSATARKRSIDGLASVPELADAERVVIADAADDALRANTERKLNRVLLLEMHAASLSGELAGDDEPARFRAFLDKASRPDFESALRRRYPALMPRLERVLAQQGQSIFALAGRLAVDRAELDTLVGTSLGRLHALQLGEGDAHHGGQTVARLCFEHGSVMYKPRSLRVDAAMASFLAQAFPAPTDALRVPAVRDRGNYGWTEFIEHIYAENHAETTRFYRNMGRWLAVMRLLGGTDIHHENLIACGSQPVAVDVESLFVAEAAAPPTGLGHAVDLAEAVIRASVLRSGLVPFRAPVLGFGGVDISAAGALPGEQPKLRIPRIVEHGTTAARIEVVEMELERARNHPEEQPDVSLHWDDIVTGFVESARLFTQLDRAGRLAPMLESFRGSAIRQIRRPTQVYVELMHMLWHPASLHDEAAAIARATDLLARNAAVVSVAPSEPEVIAAEVNDLRYGDVPVFSAEVQQDHLDAALRSWRTMRMELEEQTIRGALVTAFLNAPQNDDRRARYDLSPRHPHAGDLDRRRRRLAARALEQVLQLSVRGDDGTVTWVSPIMGKGGWSMHALQSNLYIGLGGIAVAIAGYQHEVQHARADPVAGAAAALEGVIQVMRSIESSERSVAVGGFMGLGSQILAWLGLDCLLPGRGLLDEALARAERLAGWDIENTAVFDVLEGVAGAIVPLLALADASSDARWLALAARIGRRLEATAVIDARGARWPASVFDQPIGGFAHGASGQAWALTRLGLSGAGLAGDRARWLTLGARALAFEEGLYHAGEDNWIDVRKPHSRDFPNTWCHGSVGIGLAACDLYLRSGEPQHLRTLRRAVRAASRAGWGYSHTLCHGDLSFWELRARARAIDSSLVDADRDTDVSMVISSIEEHGIVGGLARDAFTPGLMSGLAGSILQLCRMHPASPLASPLLLEHGLGDAGAGAAGRGRYATA